MIKKKILFFMHSMRENRWTEKLFSQLSYNLSKKYEIFFVWFYDIKPYDNFHWKSFFLNENENISFFKYLVSILKFRKFIKENNIDIIIWTNDFLNIFLYSSTLFLKIKKIWTIHSNPILNFNIFIKRLIIKIFYPFFDNIVCVSKTQEKIMVDKFKLKNTQTIYNFFNIEKELLKFNEKLNNTEENIFKYKFNFLMISRLDELKWFLPTLRIFNKLLKKYKDINLIILWEWEYRENIENYINKNNLINNIFLLGSKKNIYPYLLNSDCFLFPTLTEAFWLVLIEALLTNKIIISSDCYMGPKEILNIDYNTNIYNYPFYWDYWILIESFTIQDLDKYKNNVLQDLDNKEKVLFELIEKIYLDKNSFSSKYTHWLKRARKFNINNIIKDWENLLW